MLVHIVMWKLKNEENKMEIKNQIKTKLESLKPKIAQIKDIKVGIDLGKIENNYDVALYSEFENEEDLKIYSIHPEHLVIVDFIKTVVKERIAIDYFK